MFILVLISKSFPTFTIQISHSLKGLIFRVLNSYFYVLTMNIGMVCPHVC